MSAPSKILTFSNEFEAMLLDGLLKEKNIPHIIRSYHDSVYDGLWQTQSGWGHLEAPDEYRDEIMLIFTDMTEDKKEIPIKVRSEGTESLIAVFTSRYFYIGFFSVLAGIGLNIASQTYLHNYMSEGLTLPMLSDLILDNLPVIDLSLVYDIVCLIPIFLMFVYIVHKKEYNRIPFILLMVGIFYLVRGVFIVLTPFGNPPMFGGSDPLFNGFSKYELGVYPSGHAGNVFMLFLLVNDSLYKKIIIICLTIVIIALFLSHGHYSIDIFSGIFFAYAIKAYGMKHFSMFDLSNHNKDGSQS